MSVDFSGVFGIFSADASGHVFQGVYKEPQMVQIMDRFRTQLGRVSKEIEKRNEQRLNDPDMGFKNIHADPKIVECSVAV